MSVRPVYTKEANAEADKQINSNAYLLNIQGKLMREMEKDFIVTAYCVTRTDNVEEKLENINAKTPIYSI